MAEKPANDDFAIRVANLSKVFKIYTRPADMFWEIARGKPCHKEFLALRDISFTVRRGQVVGIIGRNGAGKSTLLKILAGTLDKTVGEVDVRGRISSILELGTGFHPEYNGRENIYLGGLMVGLSRQEIRDKMDWIIDFSELRDFIDQPFKTYSTGMQARLTFATAICIDPDILIIDEALSVGDAKFQHKSFGQIEEFRRVGHTILLVSHDVNTISTFCDYAILLEGGQIHEQGEPHYISKLYYKMLFSSDGPPAPGAAGPGPEAMSGAESDQAILEKMPPEIFLDPHGITREKGFLWRVALSESTPEGDSNDAPRKSVYVLYEDGVPLRPGHYTHAQISQYGRGAYSHWGKTLYFSTSDNSDPRVNGRNYTLRRKDLAADIPVAQTITVTANEGAAELPEHMELRHAALAKLGLEKPLGPNSARQMRMGNRKAEVLDIGILDPQGESVVRLTSGAKYTFFFHAVFYEDVEAIAVGFLIRNIKGVDMFGINSVGQKMTLSPKKKGDTIYTRLPLTMWLTNGTYFLSCGVANPNADTDVQYDFRYDALQFDVEMISGLHINSVVNLAAKLEVDPCS